MDRRLCSVAYVIATGLIFGAGSSSVFAAENEHPGRVIDRIEKRGMASSIKAWRLPRRTGGDRSCPDYGDAPLDSRVSDTATGSFAVKIDTDNRTYTLVYCANGYHTKVDRNLPNDADGSPVVPFPVRLRRQSDPSATSDNEVLRYTLRTLNELSYMRSINQEAFDKILDEYANTLGETDDRSAEVLRSLINLINTWSQ